MAADRTLRTRSARVAPLLLAGVLLVALPLLGPAAGTPAGAQAARTTVVTITDRGFEPAALEVAVGTTVVWRNASAAAHSVQADDGSFASGRLAPRVEFRHTFREVGDVAYGCRIHPSERATISVREPAGSGRPATGAATPPPAQAPSGTAATPPGAGARPTDGTGPAGGTAGGTGGTAGPAGTASAPDGTGTAAAVAPAGTAPIDPVTGQPVTALATTGPSREAVLAGLGGVLLLLGAAIAWVLMPPRLRVAMAPEGRPSATRGPADDLLPVPASDRRER